MTGRRRAPLTRDRVVRAALDLVDRRGGAALTMRNLAGELGVEAMSLYHHVSSREDLLDAVADLLVVTELRVPAETERWDAALSAFATGIRRTAQHHPAAFQLVGLRPLRSERAMYPVVALLERLQAAGFDPGTVVVAYRLAVAFARGFALAEIAGLTLVAAPPPSLPPPLQAAVSRDNDDVFLAGVRTIVAGLEARKEPGRGAAGGVGVNRPATPRRRPAR